MKNQSGCLVEGNVRKFEYCIPKIDFWSIFSSKHSHLKYEITIFLWDKNIFPCKKIKLPLLSPIVSYPLSLSDHRRPLLVAAALQLFFV